MNGNTGAFPSGVETFDHGVVIRENLGLDVGGNATHGVVGGRHHRNGLVNGIYSQIGPGELCNVGKLGFENFCSEVSAIKEYVVFVGPTTATLCHFLHHVTSDNVSRREVFNSGCVALHKTLA